MVAGGILVAGQAYIAHERRAQEHAALSRAEGAARSLEQYLLRALEAIDLFHDMVQRRQAMLASGDVAGAAAIAAQIVALADKERFNILQVATIGSDGWTTWSTTPGAPRVDLSDREHFTAHRDGRKEMFVSAPVRGRQSQRQAVQFTRPLLDPAGDFHGVAVVSLDPIAFSEGLQTLPLAGRDALTVIRRDGVIIARSRDPEEVVGRRLLPPLDGPRGAEGRMVSTVDGVERFIYRRGVDGTPLSVGVGLDAGAELASFEVIRKAVNASTAGAAILSLTLALLAVFWIQRRRAEEGLKAARAGLESSRRMEALGRLVSGVAHDFNHVLQAVVSGVHLIEKTSTDPDAVRRYAGMIAAAAQRGASVTRRLLSLARDDEPLPEPVEPRAVLDEIAELLRYTLGPQVLVAVEAEPRLPMAFADRRQLEATLVNLAINARDAMEPRGGGTITLSAILSPLPAGSASPDEPGLCIAVRDTGIGMGTDILARAGEAFFTTKPRGEGTGLGLTMARGFAEQSGGALAVESAAGQGTTVRLWLPIAPAGARERLAEPAAAT